MRTARAPSRGSTARAPTPPRPSPEAPERDGDSPRGWRDPRLARTRVCFRSRADLPRTSARANRSPDRGSRARNQPRGRAPPVTVEGASRDLQASGRRFPGAPFPHGQSREPPPPPSDPRATARGLDTRGRLRARPRAPGEGRQPAHEAPFLSWLSWRPWPPPAHPILRKTVPARKSMRYTGTYICTHRRPTKSSWAGAAGFSPTRSTS